MTVTSTHLVALRITPCFLYKLSIPYAADVACLTCRSVLLT